MSTVTYTISTQVEQARGSSDGSWRYIVRGRKGLVLDSRFGYQSRSEAEGAAHAWLRSYLSRSSGSSRDRSRSSRAKRGPVDEGVKYAKMVSKWSPAGRRLNPSEKLEYRRRRLREVLERHGIPYRAKLDDILVDAAMRESHRSDSARFRRAYGWS